MRAARDLIRIPLELGLIRAEEQHCPVAAAVAAVEHIEGEGVAVEVGGGPGDGLLAAEGLTAIGEGHGDLGRITAD